MEGAAVEAVVAVVDTLPSSQVILRLFHRVKNGTDGLASI